MTHRLTPREKVAAAIIDSGVNIGTSTWPDDIQVDALKLSDAILTALASGTGDQIPGPDDATAPSSMGWPSAHGEAAREQPPRLVSGDHAELARLAEAATKGPWFETEGHPSGRTYGIHAEAGPVVVFRGIAKPHGQGEHNAAFIAAANPATVLALLAENAALRGELDHVRSLHNRATDRSRHWEIASINADNRATEAERELSEHRITADLLVSTLKADKAEAERKLAEAVGLKHLTDGQIFAAINAAVTITRDRNGVDNGAVCISPEKFRTFLSKEAERG